MKTIFRLNAKTILVFFILLLGLYLRLHNYAVYPQRGASSDEYTYSFLGISLLTRGIPISWSNIPVYENKYDLTINKLYFPIVYPYFDHPPLNGLLVGSWALLFGEDEFAKVRLRIIRLVPIFLSTVSSILIFLLARAIYDYKTAIWAILIYSTTTIFVINGRVVFAENLLTPLFLSSIYLFLKFSKAITTKKTILLGIISGLSFWAKEVGIVVFLSLFFLFATQRIKTKYILVLCLTTFLFFLSYLAYGAYYDWDLFLKVITAQAGREVGPQTLHLLTTTPVIVNKVYYDGWYFFGFLCMFFSFFEYRKNRLLIIPAAVYLVILIFSLTRHGEMGWYMIPLFPFMALFSARILVESLRRQSWFILLLLLFVGLYEIQYLYEENFGLTPIQFRTLTILLFVPPLLAFLLGKEKLFNILGNILFYLLIIGNILLTYTYVHPA